VTYTQRDLITTVGHRPRHRVRSRRSGPPGAMAPGCRVTGVDITEAYVEVAAELTDRCGLSDLCPVRSQRCRRPRARAAV